jgi:hypothetical protein
MVFIHIHQQPTQRRIICDARHVRTPLIQTYHSAASGRARTVFIRRARAADDSAHLSDDQLVRHKYVQLRELWTGGYAAN